MNNESKILLKAIDLAKTYTLEELLQISKAHTNRIDVIINEVCKELEANVDEITMRTRRMPTVLARQLAMHFVNVYCENIGLKEIALRFGLKDHSTVCHANKVINDWIFLEENKERYDKVKKKIEVLICK